MTLEQIQTETVILTPTAVEAVRELMKERELQGYALRVFVAGSSCSGLQYGMALEKNIRPEDMVSEFEDIKVVVDEVSINYLQGATVDYVDGPMGTGFKIDNPNAAPSCGCSSSSSSAQGGCSGCG